jgi:AcrR family transcriptional regulator
VSSPPRAPSDRPAPRARRRGPGRPATIDREKVLGVARDVFLEQGIRATTLEVAERASVSEGSIFHHFKTKDALFREAMRLDAEDLAVLFTDAVGSLEGLELRPALEQLATRLLEIGRQAIPLMMMMWSNPGCGMDTPPAKKTAYRSLILRLIGFFEARKHAGQLRDVDPEVVARTFMGAIHHYTMVRLMVQDAEMVVIPEGMFARGLVDIVLGGAAAKEELLLPVSRRPARGL